MATPPNTVSEAPRAAVTVMIFLNVSPRVRTIVVEDVRTAGLNAGFSRHWLRNCGGLKSIRYGPRRA
jgi:hypothetical protein